MLKTREWQPTEGGSTRGPQRVLRIGQLREVTGYARSSIYEMIAAGEFPRPIPLGPRVVGWLADEVAIWQAKRIAERDHGAADAS
jgi:prophage regulatory protein